MLVCARYFSICISIAKFVVATNTLVKKLFWAVNIIKILLRLTPEVSLNWNPGKTLSTYSLLIQVKNKLEVLNYVIKKCVICYVLNSLPVFAASCWRRLAVFINKKEKMKNEKNVNLEIPSILRKRFGAHTCCVTTLTLSYFLSSFQHINYYVVLIMQIFCMVLRWVNII